MKTFKCIMIASALFLASNSLFSQEIVSKKGEPYLPEQGDWALQINATPFFNFFGNLFSNTGANTLNVQPLAGYPMTVAVKYFTEADRAYRARTMLNIGSSTVRNFVPRDQQAAPFDPNITATDSRRTSNANIMLSAGKEYRRGVTRLQGYYGAEAILMFNRGTSINYNYGNSFSGENTIPNTTVDFETGAFIPTSSRIISQKSGAGFGIGVGGFAGAEYFILPKFSIGIEYNLALMYSSEGVGRVSSQYWDTVQNMVVRTNSRTAGSSNFGLNTDISGGAINLTLHF
jgi:hypothetical protein